MAALRAAEFFAGIGLVRAGLERTGWSIVFANDIDPKKHQMYTHNFPDRDFRLDDIRCLKPDEIPDVTLATASFPCNDLSLAGRYAGLSGANSSIVWSFLRLMREMGERRPPFLMLENVASLLTSQRGNDLLSLLTALNEMGYHCDLVLVDALHFVPQSRARLFVFAMQTEKNAVQPAASQPAHPARPPKVLNFIAAHPEIAWALQPLPALPVRTLSLAEILEDIPYSSSLWWNESRSAYLLSQMSERHRATADAMIVGEDYRWGTVFRRVRQHRTMGELRVDGVAGCLRTPKGGSARQIVFKGGRGSYHVRLMTPRECARLQGASDDYRIEVPANQALFGFGDAVCVPVIEWLSTHYLLPVVEKVVPPVIPSALL